MFEVAELGHKVSKADYNEKVPTLRTQLLTTPAAIKHNLIFLLLF